MKATPLTPLVILALLSLLLAVVVTETVLYSRNTPEHHPEWVIGKRLMAGTVMGGTEASETRNLLRLNRLNFDEWHGYHEILLDRIFALGSLTARIRLGPNGYLIAIVNKAAAGYSGVRLSRHAQYPNIFFRANRIGEFLVTEPLENVAFGNDWHDLRLRFEDGTLRIVVDGQSIGAVTEIALDEQVIGFRSGRRRALIDELEVRADDGSLIIAEDFRNDRGFWPTLVIMFTVLFATAAAVYLIARRRDGDGKPALFSLILVEGTLLVAFVLYFLFDYYAFSKRYHFRTMAEWVVASKEVLNVEAARRYVFTAFPFPDTELEDLRSHAPAGLIDFLGLDLTNPTEKVWLTVYRGPAGQQTLETVDDNRQGVEAYLDANPLDSSIRVLLLGTSQTWGVGAQEAAGRMAPTLQSILAQAAGPGHDVAVINASKWGSRSGPLSERYRDHLALLRPDIVAVNLANNDSEEGFAENLSSIAETSRSIGARTLFVLEPNSIEAGNKLGTKHGIMRQVADAHGIPVADLHGHVSAPALYDSGLIWWDGVHMTSYGQRLAAEFIGRSIMENLDLSETGRPVLASPDAGN